MTRIFFMIMLLFIYFNVREDHTYWVILSCLIDGAFEYLYKLLQFMIWLHYFVSIPLLLVLTFLVGSMPAGHVFGLLTEHVVLPIPRIVNGLQACWTRVWIASGANGHFCELHGYMRTETVAIPWSVRARSTKSSCCRLTVHLAPTRLMGLIRVTVSDPHPI